MAKVTGTDDVRQDTAHEDERNPLHNPTCSNPSVTGPLPRYTDAIARWPPR
jgi:hypothetical protein